MAKNKKASTTQSMANLFPGWADTRSDEQSLGFQILNTFGNQLDDLSKQVQTVSKNYFLPTANQSEIDVVYRHELATTFNFAVDESDPQNPIYENPTISGRIGNEWHSVSVASNNDIESFWYASVPNRVDTTVTNSDPYIVLSGIAISQSPIETFDADPHLSGHLWVTLSGGTSYISTENGQVHRGLVTLEGMTRKGTEESETMVFLFDSTQRTQKEWKSLDRVSIYGIDPDTATIEIASARYDQGPYLDHYNLDHNDEGDKVDTFWDLGTTVSGQTTLDMVRYTTSDFSDIVFTQITQQDVIRRSELLDLGGSNISGLDIAIQPFSDRAWVVTSTGLYLYSTDRHLPSLNLMEKKDYDSSVIIDVNRYHNTIYDEVELEYFHLRPNQDVARHRVYIEKPDGTKVGLLNGVEVSFSSDFWQFDAGSGDRSFRPSEMITLDQRGDYVVTLEVQYTDLSIDIDQRVLSVNSRQPLASFSLPFTAAGIDFDSDQRMWVLDVSGVHHRIDTRKDIALVDFDQKILFFHENYEEFVIEA